MPSVQIKRQYLSKFSFSVVLTLWVCDCNSSMKCYYYLILNNCLLLYISKFISKLSWINESQLALCGARVERFPLTINLIVENIFSTAMDEVLWVKHFIAVFSRPGNNPFSRKLQVTGSSSLQLADSEDNFACYHEFDCQVHHVSLWA